MNVLVYLLCKYFRIEYNREVNIDLSQVIESNRIAAKKRRSDIANKSSSAVNIEDQSAAAMSSQDNPLFHEIMKQEDVVKVEELVHVHHEKKGEVDDEIIRQKKEEILTSVFGNDITPPRSKVQKKDESKEKEMKTARFKIRRPKFNF